MKGASHGSISAADDVSLPLSGRTGTEKRLGESLLFFFWSSCDCSEDILRGPSARAETLTCVVMRARLWESPAEGEGAGGQNGNPLTARPARLASPDGKITAYPNRNSLSSTPGRSMARPPERNVPPPPLRLCRQAALSLISASLLSAVTLLSLP